MWIDDGIPAPADSPLGKFRAAKKAAGDLLAKAEAENRPMTDSELKLGRKYLDECEAIQPQLEAAMRAKSAVGDLFTAEDGMMEDGTFSGSLGEKGGGYTTRRATKWAQEACVALARVGQQRSGFGQPASKALLGTVTAVGTILDTVNNPDLPTTLLELIPREPRQAPSNGDDSGNSFSYLYESGHVDASASVADGSTKPTSTVTWSERLDRFRVFASLSEALPERFLEDWPKILQLLSSHLGVYVLNAIETAVLTGNAATAAPKDDFNGLLNTSGVQVVAAASDLVQTITNARLALTTLGHTPTALALAPADLSRFELMKSTAGEYLWPGGRKQIAEFLNVGTIVTSTKLTAATTTVLGQAWLGDWSQAKLLVRSDTTLKIIQPGSLAESNQFKFRVEGRVGFAVTRPAAFAKIAVNLTP